MTIKTENAEHNHKISSPSRIPAVQTTTTAGRTQHTQHTQHYSVQSINLPILQRQPPTMKDNKLTILSSAMFLQAPLIDTAVLFILVRSTETENSFQDRLTFVRWAQALAFWLFWVPHGGIELYRQYKQPREDYTEHMWYKDDKSALGKAQAILLLIGAFLIGFAPILPDVNTSRLFQLAGAVCFIILAVLVSITNCCCCNDCNTGPKGLNVSGTVLFSVGATLFLLGALDSYQNSNEFLGFFLIRGAMIVWVFAGFIFLLADIAEGCGKKDGQTGQPKNQGGHGTNEIVAVAHPI